MSQTAVSDRYASAAEALGAARDGLSWLARSEAAELTGDERAELLRGLAALDSIRLAASSAVLSAFSTAEDYAADGSYGPRPWLAWQTRTSPQAASVSISWAKRLADRRRVADALAGGLLSLSYAAMICRWLDQLPADVQDEAEKILVEAAIGGVDREGASLLGLAGLFEEIRASTAVADVDDDKAGEREFGSRQLRLSTHFRGRGYLRGDLTAEGAQVVGKVLDALGKKTGPEDNRSPEQRAHDALVEACERLIAAGFLPQRAGQPVQLQVHITLAQLLGLAESDPALSAWLAGRGLDAPPGADCDAQLVPVVTGDVDPAVLAGLARRYLGLPDDGIQDDDTILPDGIVPDGEDHITSTGTPEGSGTADSSNSSTPDSTGSDGHAGLPGHGGVPEGTSPDSSDARGSLPDDSLPEDTAAGASLPDGSLPGGSDAGGSDAGGSLPDGGARGGSDDGGILPGNGEARGSDAGGSLPGNGRPGAGGSPRPDGLATAGQLAVRDALLLLSGPTGLAAFLRGYLAGPALGVSLPLDTGKPTATIPHHLRRLVTLRDGHCRFPGCDLAPAACEVHHVVHRAHGGPTSLENLALLCRFHHGQVVHRRHWGFVLHADGTTTATSPDGSRVLHSHAPVTAA